MALFTPAFTLSKINEGGWVNDPNDIGGETYRGISRKFNPKWNGWSVIDEMKKKGLIKKNYTDSKNDVHRAFKLAKQDEEARKANDGWMSQFKKLTL